MKTGECYGILCATKSWKGVVYMAILTAKKKYVDWEEDKSLQSALDRGIDDMESERELPLNEAMKKITELRNIRRNARI